MVGMWILLVDVFTAGPMGPSPRLFGVGVDENRAALVTFIDF
jgi:hypothetical protein